MGLYQHKASNGILLSNNVAWLPVLMRMVCSLEISHIETPCLSAFKYSKSELLKLSKSSPSKLNYSGMINQLFSYALLIKVLNYFMSSLQCLLC